MALILIIAGILVALLVHRTIGIALVVVGLVLLLFGAVGESQAAMSSVAQKDTA